jgi:hypothetical protein
LAIDYLHWSPRGGFRCDSHIEFHIRDIRNIARRWAVSRWHTAILTFDILVNILLTLIFVYHLGPIIRSNRLMGTSSPISFFTTCLGYCCASTKNEGIVFHTGNAKVAKRIEKLVWRSLIGSCLVLIPTAANMTQLTIVKGREMGFLCIIICNSDSRFSRYGEFIMLIT